MESISKDIPRSHEPTMRLYAKHNLLTRTLHSLNMVAISALIATGIVMMVGGHRLESIGRSIHEVFYFLLFGVGAVYLAVRGRCCVPRCSLAVAGSCLSRRATRCATR